MRNALVVGIDPGITTGIAILDANGNVLDIHSKRDITKAEIIRRILRFGKPVIVSSDIMIAPRAVEKIAVKLGCVLYSPEISPRLNEKKELTKDYYSSLNNDHEVDALFAAMKAWKQHRVLFSRVTDVITRFGKQEKFPDIVLKIMKEESPNIEDAVREFIGKESQATIETIPKTKTDDFIEKLKKKIDEKQGQIEHLQNQNILLSKALNETRKEIGKLKQATIGIKIIEPEKESDSINYIRKLRRIESKGYYPVVEFDKIDNSSLEGMDNKIDLKQRVVSTNNSDNLNLLNSKEPKCLIIFNDIPDSKIGKLEFPVVKIDKSELESFDDIKAIKIDYIEKRLTDAKKTGLVGWLKGYRKRKE